MVIILTKKSIWSWRFNFYKLLSSYYLIMDDILAEINNMYDELVILENKEYEIKLKNIQNIKKIKEKDMVLFIILIQIVVSFDPGMFGIIHGKLNPHSIYLMYVFCFVYEQLEKRIPYF